MIRPATIQYYDQSILLSKSDEEAHYLSLSNEDRKKVPNRKAILESLCLLPDKDDEDDTETKEVPKEMTSAGDVAPIVIGFIPIALAAAFFVGSLRRAAFPTCPCCGSRKGVYTLYL